MPLLKPSLLSFSHTDFATEFGNSVGTLHFFHQSIMVTELDHTALFEHVDTGWTDRWKHFRNIISEDVDFNG